MTVETSKIFVPKKLRVGFKNQADTFTGLLAYVTYYDEKGNLRKEPSFEKWRNKTIGVIEIDNEPSDGFVLNKGVRRDGGYFGSGRSMVRVHHKDNFEFEITVTNLLEIIRHADISRGDIAVKCVFAWEGAELILLPTNSNEYREALKYTEKQSASFSSKNLVPGRAYNLKKQSGAFIYVGHFLWYDFKGKSDKLPSGEYQSLWFQKKKEKKHVFFDGKKYVTPATSSLVGEIGEDFDPDFSNILSRFISSVNAQRIVGFEIKPLREGDELVVGNESLFQFKNKGIYKRIEFKYVDHALVNYDKQGDHANTHVNTESGVAEFSFSPEFILSTRENDGYGSGLKNDETKVVHKSLERLKKMGVDTSICNDKLKVWLDKSTTSRLRDLGFGHIQYILEDGSCAEFGAPSEWY